MLSLPSVSNSNINVTNTVSSNINNISKAVEPPALSSVASSILNKQANINQDLLNVSNELLQQNKKIDLCNPKLNLKNMNPLIGITNLYKNMNSLLSPALKNTKTGFKSLSDTFKDISSDFSNLFADLKDIPTPSINLPNIDLSNIELQNNDLLNIKYNVECSPVSNVLNKAFNKPKLNLKDLKRTVESLKIFGNENNDKNNDPCNNNKNALTSSVSKSLLDASTNILNNCNPNANIEILKQVSKYDSIVSKSQNIINNTIKNSNKEIVNSVAIIPGINKVIKRNPKLKNSMLKSLTKITDKHINIDTSIAKNIYNNIDTLNTYTIKTIKTKPKINKVAFNISKKAFASKKGTVIDKIVI